MTNRASETLRRLYADVVRGRSRVRVIPEIDTTSQAPGAFILSPYRSGTTLLRYCLDSHPQLAVPPETDYLIHLAHLVVDPAALQGMDDLGYSRFHSADRVRRFARSFLDTYAAGQGASMWCDKSPRYAEDPRSIQTLFPDARYIILHRHPLDQIESFTRTGTFTHPALGQVDAGQPLIRAAAEYWRGVTRELIRAASAADDQSLTITYEDLCARPEVVLTGVLDRLDLPWSDNVVNFHKFNHDKGRESGRISGTTGFSPTSGRWKAWADAWVQDAWGIVADAAEAIGYTKNG